jgi:hypothetical protein
MGCCPTRELRLYITSRFDGAGSSVRDGLGGDMHRRIRRLGRGSLSRGNSVLGMIVVITLIDFLLPSPSTILAKG